MSPRRFLFLLILTAGCGQEPSRPRELPFPSVETRAPFPELAASVAGETPRQGGESDFERALRGDAQPAAPAAPAEAAAQSIPLGGQILGELPAGSAWRWSTGGGVTLIVHAADAGRPAALIYAESFSSKIHDRPSEEHHRFQVAVDPERAERYLDAGTGWELIADGPARQMGTRIGLDRDETGQLVQLLATRTRGRGLGFSPEPGSFTGWRWVGRNAHGVTLRLGRHSGSWAELRPWPAELAKAMANLAGGEAETGGAPAASSAGVPAYLVLGSATDRYEQSGVHFALLCARSPECAVAEDLAAFLASFQPAEASRIERLISSPPNGFEDLAREVGLEIRGVAEVPGS